MFWVTGSRITSLIISPLGFTQYTMMQATGAQVMSGTTDTAPELFPAETTCIPDFTFTQKRGIQHFFHLHILNTQVNYY